MLSHPLGRHGDLVLLQEHHAEELFALIDANRAHLRQWLPWLDANTAPEHTRAFVSASLEQLARRNGFSGGIRGHGRLAGVIGLHAIDWPNRATSLGYWLAASAQGQGLVTLACAAVLDHVFDDLRLELVEIRCAVDNRRSRAIPGRLGFTEDATLRHREWLYDHWVDHVVYSMTATEWRVRRPNPGGA
jgi:ribosomal-protein-serine acetyltransferase